MATDGALNCVIGDAGACAYWVAASVGRPITPAAVIEMQTIEAARSAGREADLGSIEVGKRADIVVRNTSTSDTSPGVNPVHQLALTLAGRNDRHGDRRRPDRDESRPQRARRRGARDGGGAGIGQAADGAARADGHGLL